MSHIIFKRKRKYEESMRYEYSCARLVTDAVLTKIINSNFDVKISTKQHYCGVGKQGLLYKNSVSLTHTNLKNYQHFEVEFEPEVIKFDTKLEPFNEGDYVIDKNGKKCLLLTKARDMNDNFIYDIDSTDDENITVEEYFLVNEERDEFIKQRAIYISEYEKSKEQIDVWIEEDAIESARQSECELSEKEKPKSFFKKLFKKS